MTDLRKLTKDGLASLDLSAQADHLHFEHPADESHGDWSTNIALQVFGQLEPELKKRFKSPLGLAEELTSEMMKALDWEENLNLKANLAQIKVAKPGFINFSLSDQYLLSQLDQALEKQAQYGSSGWHQGESWLVEHTSPNPNKAMHLGHLRNNLTGMAVANLLAYQGIKVTRDCIDNNRGIAIAKLMWGYLKFARRDGQEKTDLDYWFSHQDEWQTPEQAGQRPDKFMDQLYVKAAEDFKNDPGVEKQVRQLVVDWEAHDEKNWALWEKVLSYVYQGQQLTLTRLGNKWDYIWHEHEHYQQGKDMVKPGLKQGIFKKSQGAVVTNLEKYGIPDTVVIKADGTALYITQDLALTRLKKERFHPQRMFWVIGPEQSLAMKQTFAVCEQLGIVKFKDCIHLIYGYMSIKGQGKMSSRSGNVLYIDDLLDEAKEKIAQKMSEIGADFSDQEREKIAEKVGVGAVKYSILRVSRLQDMAFDFDESLSFEGNSGPYLQYTYARCQSVWRKAEKQLGKVELSQLIKTEANWWKSSFIKQEKLSQSEQQLLRVLTRFPEVALQSAQEYSPHHLTRFLFELAQAYSSFYNQESILEAKTSEQRKLRLQLTRVVAIIIQQGLALLGIEVVEQM